MPESSPPPPPPTAGEVEGSRQVQLSERGEDGYARVQTKLDGEEKEKTLYLFGDQTFQLQPHLSKIATEAGSTRPVLNEFLNRIYEKWKRRDELGQPTESFQQFYAYEGDNTSSEEGKMKENRDISMEMALAVTFQIANFMTFAFEKIESGKEEASVFPASRSATEFNDGESEDANNINVLGFCTGSLTAAAIACSRSLAEVAKFGIQAVQIAHEIGLDVSELSLKTASIALNEPFHGSTSSLLGGRDEDHVSCAAQAEERHIDSHTPWALAILGEDAEERFEEYVSSLSPVTKPYPSAHIINTPYNCDVHETTCAKIPYIIAYPPRGITVQAPPLELAKIRNVAEDVFAGLELKTIPIYGLYHAPQHYERAYHESKLTHRLRDSIPQDLSNTPGTGFISGQGKAISYVVPSLCHHEAAAKDQDPFSPLRTPIPSTFLNLAVNAVQQILLQPLRWRPTIHIVARWCQGLEDNEVVEIVPDRSSKPPSRNDHPADSPLDPDAPGPVQPATLPTAKSPSVVPGMTIRRAQNPSTQVREERENLMEDEEDQERGKAVPLKIYAFGTKAGQAFIKLTALECEVVEIPG